MVISPRWKYIDQQQPVLYDGQKTPPLCSIRKRRLWAISYSKPNHSLWDKHHRELYFYDVSKAGARKPLQWNEQLPATTRLVYPSLLIVRVLYGSGSVDTDYANTMPPPVNSGHSFQVTAYGLLYQPMQTRSFGDFAYGWGRCRMIQWTRSVSQNSVYYAKWDTLSSPALEITGSKAITWDILRTTPFPKIKGLPANQIIMTVR